MNPKGTHSNHIWTVTPPLLGNHCFFSPSKCLQLCSGNLNLISSRKIAQPGLDFLFSTCLTTSPKLGTLGLCHSFLMEVLIAQHHFVCLIVFPDSSTRAGIAYPGSYHFILRASHTVRHLANIWWMTKSIKWIHCYGLTMLRLYLKFMFMVYGGGDFER